MSTSVTALPLVGMSTLGTVKTGGIQVHTMRQVSVINAPNLMGADGDLVMDSGSLARQDNGKMRVRGGIAGATNKVDTFTTGVWNNLQSVGSLTVEEHIAAGTLLTGVKIPHLGTGTMDASKTYTLRNVGTDGHIAWGAANDLAGDQNIQGLLSVSGSVTVGQDVSCSGFLKVGTSTDIGGTLSVAGATQMGSTLSVAGTVHLLSACSIAGDSVLQSTLSVSGATTLGGTLSVASSVSLISALECHSSLSVASLALFGNSLSVTGDISVDDIYVRGVLHPLTGSLSVGQDITTAGALNVAGIMVGTSLSVHSGLAVSGGDTGIECLSVGIGKAGANIDVTGGVSILGDQLLQGMLSVSNASSVVLGTPNLSVSGEVYVMSKINASNAMDVNNDLSCGGAIHAVGTLTMASGCTIAQGATVGTTLSVAGKLTVAGDLEVQGATTTVTSSTLTVEDKTLEIGAIDTPTDTAAVGSAIIMKGGTDKTITYTRSSSGPTTQVSAFEMSEDVILGKKTTPFNNSITSRLTTNSRSHVLHMGDMASADGHWMIVADIVNGKLQFWYGTDILDNQTMEGMPATAAVLAFEIQKPA